MPDPRDEPGIDLSNIEAIQSLETARMTLRWALERLRSVEKLNAETSRKAEWELKMRLKAEEEFKVQLDLERSHLADSLRERQARMEKEYAGKLADWERQYEDLAARARADARARMEEAQAGLAGKQDALRQAVERLGERERGLAEREKEFEAFCALQRAQMEREVKRIEEEAERKVLERYGNVQRVTEDRLRSLEQVWQREKELLVREADEWRRKAETRAPDAGQLQERLAAAEGRAAEMTQARAIVEQEKALLREEVKSLQGRLEQQEGGLWALKERLTEAERKTRASESALLAEEAQWRQRLKDWEKALRQREKELAERSSEVAREYRRRQAELEALKKEAKRELDELVGRYAGKRPRQAPKPESGDE